MSKTHSVPLEEVQSVLQEVRELVAPDRYIILQSLLDSHLELMRVLSEKTATLARLRKLFRIETTERLSSTSAQESEEQASEAGPPETTTERLSSSAQESEEQASEAGPPETEVPSNDAFSEGDATATNPAKKKNHGRIPGREYAANNTHVEHPDLEIGQRCPECSRGSLYLLRKTAPQIHIEGQAPLVATSQTADTLRCTTCGAVFTPELIKQEKFATSAVAIIIYLHYLLGMPFERLDGMQQDAKVPVPASVQFKLVDEAATSIEPLRQPLIDAGSRAPLFHIDDSPMKILELMGKRRPKAIENGLIDENRTGIQTTGFLSFDPNAPPVALFFTGPKHAGENLTAILERRPPGLDKPLVMSDALNRNVPKSIRSKVIEANCLTHGRRGVFDQLDSFPVEVRYVLVELAKVFAIDKRTREAKLTPEERLRVHQRESGPILGRLRRWIRRKLDPEKKDIEPNSELAKALNYILKHWTKLTRFLRVPGAPVTNNVCERLLKVAIRYRKNSSFYKTLHGAEVGDLFMSLMQTARLNGEDPRHYITTLLDHTSEVAADPEAWLPWCYRDTLAAINAIEKQAA